MATLLEKIEDDLKQSLKAHDAARVSTLRMLVAAARNAAIAARTSAKQSLDDDDVQGVIRSEVKKLKDSMVDFAKAARQDLTDSAEAELKILAEYMPKGMSADELMALVEEKVEQLHKEGVKEFGKVMGMVVKEVKGRAGGDEISAAVKKVLAKFQ